MLQMKSDLQMLEAENNSNKEKVEFTQSYICMVSVTEFTCLVHAWYLSQSSPALCMHGICHRVHLSCACMVSVSPHN